MRDSDPVNPVPVDKLRDPEAQLGGADAVPKTTYVVGEGTEPERRKVDRKGAHASGGGAPRALIWIVALLVVLGALAYFVGLGR